MSPAEEGTQAFWDARATSADVARRAVWDDNRPWEWSRDHCLGPVIEGLGGALWDGTVLDLGCGVGRLTIPLAWSYLGAQLIGVDVSPRMLALAGEAASMAEVDITWLAAGEDGQLPPTVPLDGAFSVLLMQHLPPAVCRAYLDALYARLRPGAPLVIQYVDTPGVERFSASSDWEVVDDRADAEFPTWRWCYLRR